MEDRLVERAPWHLWLIGGLALLWNGFGVFDYVATVARFEPYLSQFPQTMVDYLDGAPMWMFAIWATGVFSAFVGSILLVMRSRFSVQAFALSLTGAVASTIGGRIGSVPDELTDPGMTIVILLVASGLLLYAAWMRKRKVLSWPLATRPSS